MFGLTVEAPFALPGVPDDTVAPARPRPFELQMVDRDDLRAQWPTDGCENLSDWRDSEGNQFIRIDSHPEEGTLIDLVGEGLYRISADARSGHLAPPPRHDAWRWQRALIGQVLPFAALMNGLEVMHASAISLGDTALAVVGSSHAGKSTLAATWIGQGAAFIADDVVAIEASGDGAPLVHPGAPLLSLRDSAREFLGEELVRRLGSVVGSDESGTRIAVAAGATEPLPLGALVILHRDESHDRLEVSKQYSPDPRLVLSTSFNLVVQTPARLIAHLDLAASIAANVPVVKVVAGAGHLPTAIAGAIASELGL